MKTFNDKPLYLVNVDGEECTITTISLVENPAMLAPMYCFGEQKPIMKFSLDESKHCFISCIVRTDFPIYRIDDEGNEFYIMFDKEASEKLCQKLLRDGFQQNVSLDHNGQLISGIELQEVFLKDTEHGINPSGFEDVSEGSLFGIYHVSDENLWKECVEGRFGGVSLESYLCLSNFSAIDPEETEILSLIRKLKTKIKNEYEK